MRTVLLLAAIAITAWIFDFKWLGALVFYFLIACALWGVGDFIRDCGDGYGFSMRGQMRRQAARRTPEQDEAIVRGFEEFKRKRELKRELRNREKGWE